MKKLKIGILFIAFLLAALTCTAAAMQQEQQTLAGKLVRLHVVASSDSREDQARKLQVRDAVLAVTEPLAETGEDPMSALARMLPQIQQAAEDCLRSAGCTDPVSVTLGREAFPTRVYETFALPAGTYQSLRVTIGAGEGHNWWCVAFPSICFQATAEDLEQAAQAAGFTDGEVRLITGQQEGYTLKFKTWELLQELKNRLFE